MGDLINKVKGRFSLGATMFRDTKTTNFFKCAVLVLLSNFCFVSKNVSLAQSYYPAGFSGSTFGLWYDASDGAQKMTITNGLITKWTDKVLLTAAAQTTVANQPVLSTLFGRNIVEFNGQKGLDIPYSTILNPQHGYNLAQMVYVYPDAPLQATDTRLGTFTRNTLANQPVGTGLPEISIYYSLSDSVYRFASIGRGNNLFPDLRGTSSLVENYMLAPTGIASSQLNGNAITTTTIATPNTSTNPATLGNREFWYIYHGQPPVHWGINETILTSRALGNTERKLLELYLSWKWYNQRNLPGGLLALYNPTDTNYNNRLIGIGNEGGVDTVLSNKSSNSLSFSCANAFDAFAIDQGQYLVAADNNKTGTMSAGGNFSRWGRSWFFCKTDAHNGGGKLNIVFDFSIYGLTPGTTVTTDYYLIYNSNKGDFNTGSNFVIPVMGSHLIGSKFVFTVDANNIQSGYYTIAYAPKGSAQTQITNYSVFQPIVIVYNAPALLPVYSGNTFNTISWNIDNLNFNPIGYKIYSGPSLSALSLIDSIATGSKLIYNHYGLNNGQKYYYAVKAYSRTGTISSTFSNVHSGTPGISKAQWSVPPQLSGLTSATMAAAIPSNSTSLRYNFEITASGSTTTSGWSTSSSYKDSTLTAGTLTSFRVKTADSSNVSLTQSAWSDTVSVTAAPDSAQGGFTYNWSQFNNSDNNVYGLGPVKVTQNFAGTPIIKHVPAPGIHPRLFCNPEDSTMIRYKLKNTASGRAIARKIHAYTTLLTLGGRASSGTYSATANYAVDSLGISYLSFSSATGQVTTNKAQLDKKLVYDSLAAYKNVSYTYLDNDLSILLADEAFECWVYKGTIDATTNTSYTARAKKLANALSHWGAIMISPNNLSLATPNVIGGTGGSAIGLIYDFAFNFMTPAQQDTVRQAMANAAAHAWVYNGGSDYYGLNTTSYATTSNWTTWGNLTLNDLAMEGEPGANTTRTITYARANWNFLTYGIYETGQPYEGMGKNEIDARLLIALARRGYSMLGHPNLRAFATQYLPAITQPFGYSFLGTDLLGGSNDFYNAPTKTYDAYGGWRIKGVDVVGLKYIYPTNVAVDYVWKNYIKQYTVDQGAKDGNYEYQSATTVAPFFSDILAAIYPADYSSSSIPTLAQQAFNGSTSYFDYRGGMAVFRSGFDQNAATLWFHNRQDLGGHAYSNKNDIMYSALGRVWMPKISTNANSDNTWCDITNANSGILIDGKGTSDDSNGDKVKLPGKIVYYNNTNAISTVAGDATYAYSYQWLPGGSGFPAITKTRNSFQYTPSNLSYFNISFSNYPSSMGNYSSSGSTNNFQEAPYNVCNKVYRTVALIKDANPYVIVVDDAQKDSVNKYDYKWIGQMAADLTVDSMVVNLNNNSYRNDIIFKEQTTTGNRRFLVRILNNTGQKDITYVDTYWLPKGPTGTVFTMTNNIWSPTDKTTKVPRLTVESFSNDPKFKVMLYAYTAGSQLPVTKWTSAAHDSLLITNGGVQKMIYFPMDSTGRTNIFLANAPLMGNYVIVNKNSKKPVNVIGSNLNDGAYLEQNAGDTATLKWTVAPNNGYYTIVNKNSGKYMDVFQASITNGAQIDQKNSNSLSDQLWQITERGNGFYSVINKNSNLALTIDSSSVKNGARVLQQPYIGADNQLFNFNQQIDLIGGINLPIIPPDTVAAVQLKQQIISFGALPSKAYGSSDFAANATSNNPNLSNIITYSSNNTAVATVNANGIIHIVGAGPCTITASQAGDANYNPATPVSQNLIITPVALTITADNKTKVYGTANPTLTASYAGFVNGESQASLTSLPNISTTALTSSAVGSYSITATGAVDQNYSISYKPGTMTVGRAPLTVTADNQQKIYGTANPALTMTYTGLVNGDTPNSLATPSIGTTALTNSAVGSYPITVSGSASSTNYSISYLPGTLTVIASGRILTFAPLPAKTYGDADFDAGAQTNTNDTVFYSSSNPAIATIVNGKVHIIAAGTVNITAAVNPRAGYNDIAPETRSLTINKAAQVLNLAALPTKTYGDADFSVSATTNNQANIITYSSSNPAIATVNASGIIHILGAGMTTITVSQASDANYTLATSASQNLVVNPALLTITADNQTKVFGTANPTLTVSYLGFVNGDTQASLTTQPSISSTAQTNSPLGSYPITVSGVASANYAISYSPGTLTVIASGRILTFIPLPLKTFGDADFDPGAQTNTNDTVYYASSNPAIATIVNGYIHIVAAGTVTITASVNSKAGYNDIAPQTRSLTINKANQVLNFAALPTKTYGDNDFTANATSNNLANIISYSSSNMAVATINSTGSIHIVGAGQTIITASQVGDANYNMAIPVSQNLVVNPASLTITADNQTKIYGSANPTLTVSYWGFVNGETPANLTTLPSISTATLTGSAVGTYTISATGAVDQNYTISYIDGTLTVSPAPLTITADNQTKVFNTANPTLTVSYSGFVNGDTQTNLTSQPIISTTALTGSAVGTYPITASGATSSNYNISYLLGTLTVTIANSRILTFSPLPLKTFGDANFDPGAQTNTNDTVYYASSNPAIATIVNGKVHIVGAGTVTITASVNSKPGYNNITPQTQLLTINKANQVITFMSIPNQVLGQPPLVLNVVSSSGLPVTLSSSDATVALVNGFSVSMVGSGTAIITASQPGNANYLSATASQSVTVLPVNIVVLPNPIIPNGFTPNGDGINDTWEIQNLIYYPNCTVKIFNRSGQLVYSSVGYAVPWGGEYKGALLPAGAYYYVIDLKDSQSILTGTINLIR